MTHHLFTSSAEKGSGEWRSFKAVRGDRTDSYTVRGVQRMTKKEERHGAFLPGYQRPATP